MVPLSLNTACDLFKMHVLQIVVMSNFLFFSRHDLSIVKWGGGGVFPLRPIFFFSMQFLRTFGQTNRYGWGPFPYHPGNPEASL